MYVCSRLQYLCLYVWTARRYASTYTDRYWHQTPGSVADSSCSLPLSRSFVVLSVSRVFSRCCFSAVLHGMMLRSTIKSLPSRLIPLVILQFCWSFCAWKRKTQSEAAESIWRNRAWAIVPEHTAHFRVISRKGGKKNRRKQEGAKGAGVVHGAPAGRGRKRKQNQLSPCRD